MSKDTTEGRLYFLKDTESDKASFILLTKSFTLHALVDKMSKTGSCSFTNLPSQSEKKQYNSVKCE